MPFCGVMTIISTQIPRQTKEGKIYSGVQGERHFHVIQKMKQDSCSIQTIAASEEGFITDSGFLDRFDAYRLASNNGQMKPRSPDSYDGKELFSEDLW